MNFIIGVGASGAHAASNVSRGIAALAAHPSCRVRGKSRFYENPAFGGVTHVLFVNAAVVVDTALGAAALLAELHAIERAAGRVRGVTNGARTLDLDVLWCLDAVGASTTPAVPHPAFLTRASALVPAVEAIADAGMTVPATLWLAVRSMARATMTPIHAR